MDWAFHELGNTNRKWLECWADTLSNCGQGRTNRTPDLKRFRECLSVSACVIVCSLKKPSADTGPVLQRPAHMWKPTHILGFLLSCAISSPLNHSSGLVKGPSRQRGKKKGAPLYRNCCLLLEVSPRVEYFSWSQREVRRPEITLALFPSEKEESINSFNPVFLQFYSALFGLVRPALPLPQAMGGGLMGCSSNPNVRRGALRSRKAHCAYAFL